ncbi:hypothetical protein RIR_jg4038.t1 [Rhizophagus irregularis DAOM 181602=DAOM 197198]|nr:hypothetical protein RIR_jg4038.t1 [Rhizophagus irregularis DAOM 181602=DAOM 197198]
MKSDMMQNFKELRSGSQYFLKQKNILLKVYPIVPLEIHLAYQVTMSNFNGIIIHYSWRVKSRVDTATRPY